MNQPYKTKLAHMLDNGDKLEFESFVEASSHDDAVAQAKVRLHAVIAALATAETIDIDKTKVEMGAHQH
ncbi:MULTISPECIES: hypothetical protein [unclassified Polaromonas]|uniref:hypothetical protein n=1 Tax=unclassified Polaromonas TaxID=2638319 RepID=UPI0018C93764|nr:MULTISPECIES: hypothetical protein [unclassified Polaromonas]MBG6073289.1 hypothetical protein [Polaromonas sp. CG_9.7]MBG6115371.1 hypothetical protein [Polaromonas sp. CG_9.2]MDH6182923.1 hypothetical protein [Polaromonas sp. CG_23.6]